MVLSAAFRRLRKAPALNCETLIYRISFDALALPTAVLKLIGRVQAFR